MKPFLIPIILVAAAIGLFVLYTNPAYQNSKAVQAEVNKYNDALDKSQELRNTRDQKVAAFNTFSADDKQKLGRVLPDNVDNIRLIIDINNIASKHGLTLKNVSLGTISDSHTPHTALVIGASGSAVGSVDLGFSVSANYDDFLAFLSDLQHSLRILDIQKIGFSVGGGTGAGAAAAAKTASDVYDYSLSIRTYWLH